MTIVLGVVVVVGWLTLTMADRRHGSDQAFRDWTAAAHSLTTLAPELRAHVGLLEQAGLAAP